MSGKLPMTNGSGLRQNGGISRLATMQAQFQQKQMAEKEAKLLAMLDNQQQKMIQHTNGLLNKYNNNTSAPTPTGPLAQGKVRQMFEERRKGGGTLSASNPPKGIDRSNPLDPIGSPPPPLTTVTKTVVTSGSNNKTSTVGKRNAVNGATPPVISSRKPPSIASSPSPTPGVLNTRPSNLGSTKKPVVSTPTPPPATFSNSKPVTPAGSVGSRSRGSASSSASSSNSASAGRPSPTTALPPAASTTKYSEYASELERREATLSNKLKGLEVTEKKTKSASSTVRNKVAPSPVSGSNMVGSKASKTPPPRPKGSPPPGLDECKMCGRFFAPDRIAKHESICKKVGVKKRKVFDPTKMRMQGTEAEPYIRIVSAKPKAAPKAAQQGKKKADWRKKHEDFIATIRAAKEYQAHVAKGGNPADLPPPPPTDTSDYIQCPHCARKFSQGAAERHIPKCKNIKSNKR